MTHLKRFPIVFFFLMFAFSSQAALISNFSVTPDSREVWVLGYDGRVAYDLQILPTQSEIINGKSYDYFNVSNLSAVYNSITFDGSLSIDDTHTIVEYAWDIDSGDGLFLNGADFIGQSFDYSYLRDGRYTATLRTKNSVGDVSFSTQTVSISPVQNFVPVVVLPDLFTLYDDELFLQLDGYAFDVNSAFGDSLAISWDLDNDGAFDDASGLSGSVVASSFTSALAYNQPNRVRALVTDSTGETTIGESVINWLPASSRPSIDVDVNEPSLLIMIACGVFLIFNRKSHSVRRMIK